MFQFKVVVWVPTESRLIEKDLDLQLQINNLIFELT